jgi:glycosyltransferase involved in cell wall biosynthesis
MATICLLTPGQPSTNPRLLKEADALSEAGHSVRVFAFFGREQENQADSELLTVRSWTCTYVGGHRSRLAWLYWWTRLRHGVVRRAMHYRGAASLPTSWSLSRAQPELERAALRTRADLYIGHNIGALRAAVRAAHHWGTRSGYDFEDYLPGMRPQHEAPSALDAVIERTEREYLPRTDYVTAASPGISAAYANRYPIRPPDTILNVFPLADRPESFRPSRSNEPLRLYWFSQTIGPMRGLEDVVRAMGLLRHQALEFHLRGTWHSTYRDQLFELAASVGVHPDQIVDHLPAPPGEMVRLASSYDVGLALEHPVSEARDLCLTNKIFTYLLAGNAIVGTPTSGQRPILDELGAAGAAYEPGDVESLARALDHWYGDRIALDRARRLAWDYGTCRYNWDLEKGKFLDIVERVVAGA